MASFSPVLEETIHRALTLASDRKHELATLEHLLLALLDDKDAQAVIKACDVDLEPLRADVERYLDEDLSSLIIDDFEEARPTAGFHRVIQRAVIHVQSSGREEVTGANALVALFAERESHAVYFLQERDMTRYDAVNYISHGISKNGDASVSKPVTGTEEGMAAKITRCSSATLALGKQRLPKVLRCASLMMMCQRCCKMRLSSRSIWALCSQGRAIAVILRNGSRL